MKKYFLLLVSLMFALGSIIPVAAFNSATQESQQLQTPEQVGNDSLRHMGLRLDFGGPIPTEPFTQRQDLPEPTSMGGGWYSIPAENVPVVSLPSIKRYSCDVEINITNADLEIILSYVYQGIVESRPFGFDSYFIEALQKAGLDEYFFYRVEALMQIFFDLKIDGRE